MCVIEKQKDKKKASDLDSSYCIRVCLCVRVCVYVFLLLLLRSLFAVVRLQNAIKNL